MSRILLLLTFIVITHQAIAHLGNISGRVRQSGTNTPLTGVNVQIHNLGKAALTNELGQYRFEGLVPATYKLEVLRIVPGLFIGQHAGSKDQILSTFLDA